MGLTALAVCKLANAERTRADTLNHRIAASEKRWRCLVQNSSTGVVLLDDDLTVMFVSDAMARMLGHPIDSYLGNSLQWLTHSTDWPTATKAFADWLEGDTSRPTTIECRAFDSQLDTHIIAATATDMRHVEDIRGIVLNISDLTETRMLESQMHHVANNDPLTLLPNRAAFIDKVASALTLSSINEQSVAVAVINVDDFRLINEGYGTELGDLVLAEIALRFRQATNAEDTVARLNGDEFGILFAPGLSEQHAQDALSNILCAVNRPLHIDEQTISTQASAGLYVEADGQVTAAGMIRRASTALDAAKAGHRGNVVIFNEEMGAKVAERATVRDHLRVALERDELRLAYQPIVEMSTGKIVALEALARWTHPERGPISPATFIPIAESTNLINDLGEWAIRTACEQLRAWSNEGIDGFPVSVNLSGHQLLEPDIIERIDSILTATGIPPNRLTIEITESVLIDDTDLISERVRQIRQLGVRLSIDDFGTGYSSLSYLRRYEFDVLKIDRSFVIPLGDELDVRDHVIVKNMITLAQDLGAITVAEGIENESELQALQALGCDRAQGYLYWRPLEANDARHVLLSRLDSAQAA